MTVGEFLKNFSAESERIANNILEYIDFLSHKTRISKTMREEHIPIRAYVKRIGVPLDSQLELGGEQHDFDAKVVFLNRGVETTEIIEVVQALPKGEHNVRLALVTGKMNDAMRLEELEQLSAFPQPVIDAINQKHLKNYADSRILLVSVIGEHTFESDEVILSWIPEIRKKTSLGNFSKIYLVETARSIIFQLH